MAVCQDIHFEDIGFAVFHDKTLFGIRKQIILRHGAFVSLIFIRQRDLLDGFDRYSVRAGVMHGNVRNLAVLIEKCHVRIEQFAVAGFAIAQAVHLIPSNGRVKFSFLFVVSHRVAELHTEALIRFYGKAVVIIAVAPDIEPLIRYKTVVRSAGNPPQDAAVGKFDARHLHFRSVVRLCRIAEQIETERQRCRTAIASHINVHVENIGVSDFH